jgi:hypothetical protein
MIFFSEEWTEPYLQYGEGIATAENIIMAQNLLQGGRLCRVHSKRGAYV